MNSSRAMTQPGDACNSVNDSFDPGVPVEIGKIEKELGRLWESSDDTKTRASLINFIVYTEDTDSLSADTEVISTVAGKHACRAILIMANPQAPISEAKAWISAHCHLAGKGERQICSEQITFRLDGDSAHALPNIVFSHLDSDLPLCLWWKAEFPEPLDEKLWGWVDRLIFDSSTWKNPAHQFAIIRHLSSSDTTGRVLCDLDWTRLHSWRFALAGMFDHASAFPCLSGVESLHLKCAEGKRTTGLLLLGWLASRLNWKPSQSGDSFITSDGRVIPFVINSVPGPNLSLVSIHCGEALFELELAESGDFFESRIHAPGTRDTRQILPAGRGKIADTLLAELSRSGRHPLYTKSLELILPLLDK
jgi:glucose-6-phosphate dehydrogenase assembly protein OpcA